MAEVSDYIVAIDIGTSNVVTLVGERSEDGKVRIVSSSVTPSGGMARGDVRNVEQIVASIEKSIAKVAEDSNIKVCEAYVGLSGEHIRCSQHGGYVFIKNKDSEVSREDVDELSESMRNVKVDPGQTIIHILPQNYILDGDSDISHPVGMIGKKLEGRFNIVMGGRQNLSHLERCLNRSQIGIAEVILSSLASSEAVLLDDEKELGVIVVDIGGGTCDICIYYDKTVRYMGVIPVGGNFINKDIKSFGVLERHVEKLKVKFGSALSESIPDNKIITLASINNIPSKEISQKTLSSIIEARMLDIIERLQQILEDSNFKDKLKGPIVLTGGCSMLQDIDKLFAKHLNKDVRIASPTLYVTEDSIEKVNSPQYSTAVGLLLKGMVVGRSTKTIMLKKARPLLPPPEEERVEYYAPTQNKQQNHQKQQKQHQIYNTAPFPPRENQRGVDTSFAQQEVDDDTTTMIGAEEDFPQTEKKGKGIGGWFKSSAKKVKEIFDPEDLEDDAL